jgi:ComF family protein
MTEGMCQQTGEFFDRCLSPFFYADLVRDSFHRYKFDGYRWYAPAYGRWMSDCLRDYLNEPVDLVTWAPLSRRRRHQRGYDQARLLAHEVAVSLGMEETQLLEKAVDTPAQSGLEGAAKRRANVLGVYALKPGADPAGKRILLVDDIVTTGSTLSECARVLKTAGAERVVCVTLARGRADH